LSLSKLSAILLFCLCSISRARAGATLFLESLTVTMALSPERATPPSTSAASALHPRSFSVFAHRVKPASCSAVTRLSPDTIGSPFPRPLPLRRGKAGRHALFTDAKLVAFLRDRYRRDHLESLIPDSPGGETPDGNWYELVGASYLRHHLRIRD